MNWYKEIPKIELHIHLEGAIPHQTMWQLIQKYGGDKTTKTYNQLLKKFEYRNFSQFIEVWSWKNQFLREYEDFTLIARSVADDLANQNIKYAEMFYSPSLFKKNKLQTQYITESISKGFNKIKDLKIRLIADLVRDYGPDNENITLEEVNEVKELGVIGIGIGGSEHQFPPEPFDKLFEKARKYGFYTNAHAGEAAGPESIWGTIENLHVDRIGHGTRAGEDKELLDYLARTRLPLEVCPLSNIKTNVVKNPQDHPVKKFYEHGILMSINTDDPKMFGNSLEMEYQFLENEIGFSKEEICLLILQGIQTSWMDEKDKEKLINEFHSHPCWKCS